MELYYRSKLKLYFCSVTKDTTQSGVSFSNISISSSFSLTDGFRIVGANANDYLGSSIAGLGDVNGDGVADFIIGAPSVDVGDDADVGAAYVIFGAGASNSIASSYTADINYINPTNDRYFHISGTVASGSLGYAVSSIGDVNNDGIDDFAIGVRGDNKLYVVFGGASNSFFDINASQLTRGFTITSTAGNLGYSVSGLGDVNGDGVDDFIVSAPFTDTDGSGQGNSQGAAYVIFGKDTTQSDVSFSNIDVASLAATDGFSIQSSTSSDTLGYSVAGIGDINGDGIKDIAVGVRLLDTSSAMTDQNKGGVYVIFGKDTTQSGVSFSNISISSSFSLTDGFRIVGANANDYLGSSIAGLGDVNGDGVADFIIGAPSVDVGDDADVGAAYVIFGAGASNSIASSYTADINYINPTNDRYFHISGTVASGSLGYAVSSIGDVNNDGIDDFAIGVRGDNKLYVVFGGASNSFFDINASQLTRGFTITSTAGNLGYSVSGLGDVNGDGVDDFIVSAPFTDTDGSGQGNSQGAAYVIFGKDTTQSDVSFSNIDVASLAATDGFSIQSSTSSDTLGYSVAGIGDINGDGIKDIAVGVRLLDTSSAMTDQNKGGVYVIFGKDTTQSGVSFSNISISSSFSLTDGFRIVGANANDYLGSSIAGLGDVNGDGVADFIIGAPSVDVGDDADVGAAYVIFGAGASNSIASSYTADINYINPTNDRYFHISGTVASGSLGYAVSSIGDVNNDGIDDFAIGVRGDNKLYVVFGGASNSFFDINASQLTRGFTITSTAGNLGYSVSGLGDVNGDGVDDFIVSAPFTDTDGSGQGNSQGAAYVIFGKDTTQSDVSFSNIDVASLAATDGFSIQSSTSSDTLGYSVAGIGDINGDGIKDIAVGVRLLDTSSAMTDQNKGGVYVIFGKDTTQSGVSFSNISISSFSLTDGFKL